MSVASDLNDGKAVDVDIESFDVDGRDEAMETDVGGANAPFDDAVPRNKDEEVLVTSEGADTIPLPSTESDLGDNVASPEINIGEEDEDSDGHAEAKAGNPPIDEINETSSEINQERIIIVPNFVDDPIIFHVHSKQPKPKPRDDVLADALLSKQIIEVSDAQHMPTQNATESAVGSERPLDGSDCLVESALSAANDSTAGEAAPSTDTKTGNAQSKESEVSGDEQVQQKQIKLVDYASKLAGAQILEHSPSFKGASNLLTGDKDKYSIAPCEDTKYVVIGLSEDILVKKIKLSNYERYSSRVKKFEVLASQEYPTPTDEHWNSIGTYEAHSKSGEQVFELENPTWARYLQFRFLSHYGSEHYCTLSQIKVHGSTMLQGFHEQWAESEKKDLEFEQLSETGEDEKIVKSEDIGLDDEKQQSQGMATENTRETVEAGVDSDVIEIPPEGKDAHNQPQGDLAATDVDQPDKRENDTKLEPRAAREVMGTKGGDESTLEPTTYEIDPSESSDGETSVIHETIQGANESTPEGVVGLHVHAGGPSYSEDAERVPVELNVSQATGATSIDDSESIAIGQQNDDIPPDLDEDFSNQNANQTVESDDGLVHDDSSIVAVKDAVKAVVVDASDVIKNATRGTIKNVKDAILTSVTSTKMGNSVLDVIHVTTREELGNHSEEVDLVGKKTQEVAQSIETSSGNNTARDYVKPKADEEAAIKFDTTDEDSKSENGPNIAKKDSKAAAGRDLLQRAIVTSKESEATKLFAALSRRFPNAKCLKDLDFQAFKAKTLLAGPGGSLGGGIKMEPIFAKITNEIKSVQSTQHLYEQYTTTLKACYEAVFWDLATDLDTMQSSFDRISSRLDMTEKELNSRPNTVSNLFSFIPAAFQSGSTFQPEQSTLAYSAFTFVIFLLLVWRFFRIKNKRDPEEKCVEGVGSGKATRGPLDCIAPKNDERHKLKSDTADDIPVLCSDDLLAKELDHVKSQLTEKDEKLKCLQIQHTSLQVRYSQLERTNSALESKIEQLTPAKDKMHATRNGCTTPPPTVHCELFSTSGTMTISPTEEKSRDASKHPL